MGTENYFYKKFPRRIFKTAIDKNIYNWLNYTDQRHSEQSFKMFMKLWAK